MSVDVAHGPASPLSPASALGERIAAACAGWRGPALAALVVLISALPGLLALPPLDRDESRFAQATVQMLETGDHVNIRFQQEPRDRKPVGVYWLQAVSVQLLSSAEARDIRPYRLPSLLGAMLAAAACAWGAGAAFGPRGGILAGGVLGAGVLLSSEAFVGKTDAVLCGTVTLAMAALGRLYLAERSGLKTGRWEKLAFWFGLASAILDKGPVGPMVVGLAVLALVVADRRGGWLRDLGWGWGLLMLLLIVGPWAFSITVATDGGFWGGMVGGDIGPKMGGGHEGHWGLPGEHAVLAPLLTFPTGFLLPAALIAGWTRREEPGVRFALAWLVPSWIVFELLPTKLIHYPLPLYGALAWLAAAAATGAAPVGPWCRRIGAGLSGAVAVGLAVAAIVGAVRYGQGDGGALPLAIAVAVLSLGAGATGGWFLLKAQPMHAVAVAGVLGVLAHMAVTGLLLPRLPALWVSDRAAALLDGAGLDPRDGRTVGPVAVAGYAEPSLVFALGTDTELDATGADAAEAVAAGSPAFVEQRQDKDFRDAVAKRGAVAQVAGVISGFDYSTGRDVRLTLWKPTLLPPPSPDGPTASELEDAAAAAAANVTAATPPPPTPAAPPARKRQR